MRWQERYIGAFVFCSGFLVLMQAYSYKITDVYDVIDGYTVSWGDKLYFVAWAAWAACAAEVVRRFYREYEGRKFALYLFVDFIMCLAAGNLADELFFQPTRFEWGEYAGAVVGLLIVAFRIIQHKRK